MSRDDERESNVGDRIRRAAQLPSVDHLLDAHVSLIVAEQRRLAQARAHGVQDRAPRPTRTRAMRRRRTALVAFAIVAVLLVPALALAGQLPAPIQRFASRVGDALGVDVPGGHHESMREDRTASRHRIVTAAGALPDASSSDRSTVADGAGDDHGHGTGPGTTDTPTARAPVEGRPDDGPGTVDAPLAGPAEPSDPHAPSIGDPGTGLGVDNGRSEGGTGRVDTDPKPDATKPTQQPKDPKPEQHPTPGVGVGVRPDAGVGAGSGAGLEHGNAGGNSASAGGTGHAAADDHSAAQGPGATTDDPHGTGGTSGTGARDDSTVAHATPAPPPAGASTGNAVTHGNGNAELAPKGPDKER
ncbi:MAG: hypothetical protein JWL76_830 [Thermoleophilia bacterium]|nr:hypothetical protein [Thermoleophilia bacterium]